MNHAQLRAFHAVAAAGSFTRASAALNVTQPTLSGQVKALEESYGVRLFERRGRGVELTELGRNLHDITVRLTALEGDARQLLSAARSLTSGQLRFGADAPHYVIPLLAAFSRRHPGIQISLSFGNSEEVLQDLFERRSEVAVLADLPPDRRFDRLCELNVVEQVRNVCHTTVVQEAWERGQPLSVHGWIYAIQDGLIELAEGRLRTCC